MIIQILLEYYGILNVEGYRNRILSLLSLYIFDRNS